ncbi:restriction endonuclease subunit S [Bacillus cereus]|uniref:restriction endonuclease subunit S n=1 Tax=Bacillus cereus TaxID=1396 RepID=UPI000BF8F341|nr:restriction endonuclease subunit S [Bacillus cereus]PFO62771.1 restriction endonuclease subunit S [Bacillus cereus]PGW94605.1 restriction endonuclease subunit S [Bacillus cereus]PGY42222.1 restriction endonuclease subunit S [Bacillus cereus]
MKNKFTLGVRFQGFAGDWEQRKLGELCDEFQSGKNIKSEDVRDEGKYPVFGGNGIRGYTNTYNHDGLYALIGRQGALCGNVNISSGKAYFSEHAIAVKGNKDNETRFLYFLLDKMNLGKYSGQSAQPGLAVNKLIELTAFIPTFAEQTKISGFFKQLDGIIALHQQELTNLKQTKQGFLQKMFPKEGEFVPEIRFSGFTEDWERCKLGEIVERITRKNKNLESTLPLTISAQFGLIDQNTFFKKQVASKDISGYYLLEKGEFAYNKSYSNDFPWGVVKRLDKYDMGVLSTLYITFRPTKVNSDFLVSYYDSNKWHKEVSMRAAEGARNHGLLNISAQDFFDTELKIPKENNEQEKIGIFFKQLDDIIALHQRKLDALKATKKAFLQKMFA